MRYAVIVYKEKNDEDIEILNIYKNLTLEEAYDKLEEEKEWWEQHGYKCRREEGLPSLLLCTLCLHFVRREGNHEIIYPRCDEPVKIIVVEQDVLDL